jgi:hypothetical protein
MPPRTIDMPRSSGYFAIAGRSFDGHGNCCTLTIMRHLGWLSGLLLVISCSVDLVHNPDGSVTGAGGQAGATTTGTGGQAGTAATGSGGQAGTTSVTGEGGTRATGGTFGGSAGRGGTFGHGGAAGRAADAGESCTQIETDYGNALTAAAECTPGVAGQCQHLIDMSLSCPGCKTYVNDVTELDALSAMWQAQDCGSIPHACPAIACIIPGPATCGAASSTPGGPNAGASPGGTCTTASLSNNPP